MGNTETSTSKPRQRLSKHPFMGTIFFLLSKYANSQKTPSHKLWIIYDLSMHLCFRYIKLEMNTEHT